MKHQKKKKKEKNIWLTQCHAHIHLDRQKPKWQLMQTYRESQDLVDEECMRTCVHASGHLV